MYLYILIVFLILFTTLCITKKSELLKNLLYSVYFIITLWINIPCFVNKNNFDNFNGNLLMLPFKYMDEWGILYPILANIVLMVIMYLLTKQVNTATYTHKEIKKKYDDFGKDAIELYIIGKDLDFLGNDKYKKQTDRIKHLNNRCTLLCESTNKEELLCLYKRISKEGVKIRFYKDNDNLTNLKGQIKLDQNGHKQAIFTSKENDSNRYSLLYIKNQFLVESIIERYNEVYENSVVPEK